jgi:hypothetical protein
VRPEQACEVLGISPADGRDAALLAYREGIRRHRPERDPAGFRRVREAWEVLERLPPGWWEAAARPPDGESDEEAWWSDEASWGDALPRKASGASPSVAQGDGSRGAFGPDILDAIPGLDVEGQGALREAEQLTQVARDARGRPQGTAATLAALRAWGRCGGAAVPRDLAQLFHAHVAPEFARDEREPLVAAAVELAFNRRLGLWGTQHLGEVASRADEVRGLWGVIDGEVEAVLHGWVWDGDDDLLRSRVEALRSRGSEAVNRAEAGAAKVAPSVVHLFRERPTGRGAASGRGESGAGSDDRMAWWIIIFVLSGIFRIIASAPLSAGDSSLGSQVMRQHGLRDEVPRPRPGVLAPYRVGPLCGQPGVTEEDCTLLVDASNVARRGACPAALVWLERWGGARAEGADGTFRDVYLDLAEDLRRVCAGEASRRTGREDIPEEAARALHDLCETEPSLCGHGLGAVGPASFGTCPSMGEHDDVLRAALDGPWADKVRVVVAYLDAACPSPSLFLEAP